MGTKTLSNGEITVLLRGLSLLLHSGISVADGMNVLAEDEAGELRCVIGKMAEVLDNGDSLYNAMEFSGAFPAYVTGMIKVGEYTGRLEEALTALADYYEQREFMNNRIKNAIVYPSILLLIIMVVMVVMLVKVMPVFNEVYASLGGRLTGTALWLLKLGQVFESIMPVLCILLGVAVVALLVFMFSEKTREAAGMWCNRRFGDKGVFYAINSSHFAQALTMGLKSGLVVEDAVLLAAELMKDSPESEKRYRFCAEALAEGEGLAEAFKKAGALPAYACRMAELGARSGNIDETMEKISKRLMEEAEQAIEEKTAMIEPAMVFIAAVLIGGVLLSVMIPLMHIMTAIG
ncbi:MAG: type II secretion system F family protein [Firmicutes bacterium]|nr:type II secretion system F family protein [Bacillota bacterium]MBR6701470.1 type II secretion system F family protein [Bacillota bacterium]